MSAVEACLIETGEKEHFPQDYHKESEFGKPICMHSFVFYLLVILLTSKFTFVKTKNVVKKKYIFENAGRFCLCCGPLCILKVTFCRVVVIKLLE